jgi:F-type H+-transporting ATPase subunit b
MNSMWHRLVCLVIAWAIAMGSGAASAAAAKTGEGAHHEAIGEKDVDDPSKSNAANPTYLRTDLAIYTGIVFLIVLLVLWRFAWGPISKALDDRERHIGDNIAAAERQNQEARRLLAEYHKKLESSQAEVREILEEARRDARHTQDEILAKAREDAQRERDRAIRDIDLATQAALKTLGEKSVDLAVELAGKIVASKLSPDDHARMVKEAVTRFASRN